MTAPEVSGRTGKRILVVDDSQTVRMLLSMSLRRMITATVSEAIHGVDALEKLQKEHYDLVVTDMNMPLMGGAELVKRIRTELLQDIPIVILTTMGEDGDRDRGLALGANEYVTKPVNWNELRIKVSKHLFGRA
jgi:two-component system chemotaxis response regulator CheY